MRQIDSRDTGKNSLSDSGVSWPWRQKMRPRTAGVKGRQCFPSELEKRKERW